ncbi:glycosyltransferase family 4 protein [Flavobacterium sp. N1994]|uniref:glycosyltransferase family 4 protein n=1 Tax=Flavobacterium sp. N1994 TaxID=2986827 RepID=UPI002223E0C7|nr:glycosyltransferase family 1 protein [Flavobacterium sp. N1994]
MRIGFDAKRFFHNKTGLGNYSRSLVKLLSDAYSENDYLLFNPKQSSKFSLQNYSSKVIEVLPSNILFRKLSSLWRLYFISNDIKNHSIEIYHGLSGELPIGLNNKTKKIVTIHDLIFIRYPNLYGFFDRKIYFWKFRYAAKKADLVIAISEQTKKDIVDFLKINPAKIKVIYQGCQDVFKKEYTLEEKKAVVEKHNLPEKFILNVGTIEERKNLFTIAKSIKDIDIPLVIIGKKTSYYNEIHQYIIDHKMEKRVYHLSKLDNKELAIIYQLATIFVYPSIFEGFGIPIIEALYSKTPVITTKSGVFPEAGGPDSIYINPDNAEELKKQIISLLSNETLRNEVAEKGYQFVQKFNDPIIAEQLINCYKGLL